MQIIYPKVGCSPFGLINDFESRKKGRESEAQSKAQTNDFAHLINQLKKRFSIKPSLVDDQETTMSMGTIPEEP